MQVLDDKTLLIPDRRGNNRMDTLRNLVENPAIGLLFLVPGVNEAFRVNGEAVLSRDPALTEPFAVQGKAPRTVIVVQVDPPPATPPVPHVSAPGWSPVGIRSNVQIRRPVAASKACTWPFAPVSAPASRRGVRWLRADSGDQLRAGK